MTFHIRVVSTPGVTEELVARLVAEPGVSNMVVLAASARQPDGDAIQFDVRNRSANAVLQQIRAIHDQDSPIAVVSVDAVIGEEPDRAAKFGVVQRDIAPVWDVVEARIRANAAYPPSFYILLAIAGLIGAVGILTNSQILIVGAMVVGPEYIAIMGIALGLQRTGRTAGPSGSLRPGRRVPGRDHHGLSFGLLIRWHGRTPAPFRGVRPVSDLINSPNIFSVIVAVLAGVVGVVSLTESRANALIGVFISITTSRRPRRSACRSRSPAGTTRPARSTSCCSTWSCSSCVGAAVMRLQRVIWRSRAAG